MTHCINPFELFGLTIDSSIEELKKAYYNLSLLCHPDKGGDHDSMNMVIKSYKYLEIQLSHKSKKTYEEVEKEFSDFCEKQKNLPLPDINKITDELFQRELLKSDNLKETIECTKIFRNEGYGNIMEPSVEDPELKPCETKFTREIVMYEEPKFNPFYLDNKLDLTIKKITDFSTAKMCDYYQAFCDPETIEDNGKVDERNINEKYEEELEKRENEIKNYVTL